MPYFIGIPVNFKEIPLKLVEPYREIPKDRLHITLVYIGSLKRSKVCIVKNVLNKVTSNHKVFKVTLHGVILLPSFSKPRYLALEITQGKERLARLRNEVIVKLTNTSLTLEDTYLSDFKPHVTFAEARVKSSVIPQKLLKKIVKMGKRIKEEVEIREVILYESTGGVYRVVSRHRLLFGAYKANFSQL